MASSKACKHEVVDVFNRRDRALFGVCYKCRTRLTLSFFANKVYTWSERYGVWVRDRPMEMTREE